MSTETIVEANQQVRHMPMYRVLLHNDDKTHFDFVIMTLIKIFNKNPVEAIQITTEVHKKGIGLAGVFPLEHAELKTDQVHSTARAHGFPLTASIEPVE
jgi:ATP-dependent Clp protease adaptor protein ClpS